MTKIKIAYRQSIDFKSTGDFEKKVFHDSFNEFRMQAQSYSAGGKLKTFYEMVEHNPKANSLHYKVGFSVGLYIAALGNVVPCLLDSIGKPIGFGSHEFQIVSSDVSSKASHKVAIIYTSDWLTLMGLAGPYMIVGTSHSEDGKISTLTIPFQSNLSIAEWDDDDFLNAISEKYERENKFG